MNAATQQLTPVTNVVLENQTGGEDLPDGPQNIQAVNTSAQGFLGELPTAQSAFANYIHVGTVWMQANTYQWLNSNQTNAVGSVNLANATAETFCAGHRDQHAHHPPA